MKKKVSVNVSWEYLEMCPEHQNLARASAPAFPQWQRPLLDARFFQNYGSPQ